MQHIIQRRSLQIHAARYYAITFQKFMHEERYEKLSKNNVTHARNIKFP